MKVYDDVSLCDFEFWAGARDRIKYLFVNELEQVEAYLEDAFPDGLSVTQINDFFWFDDDFVAEILGYPDFETLMKERQ